MNALRMSWWPALALAGCLLVHAAPPEREGVGSPEREGVGSPEREGVGSPERKGVGSPEREGVGSPERKGVGSPEPDRAGPPDRAAVGPRLALSDRAGGKLAAGTYSGLRFTGPVDLGPDGRYEFRDCQLSFNTVWMAPARTVLLDHCQTGGIYFAEGGQLGWTLRYCYILGGNQGLRPSTGRDGWDVKTPTPFVVEDAIVEISSLGTPTAHVEAMQTLGGNDLRFRRVRFITHGPKNDGVTGQTAAINVLAGHTLFEDCEFAEAGAYYYTVYCDGPENVFVRCRFGRGAASYLYPTTGARTAPVLFDCTDLVTGAPLGP